jgi:hypothetical protein
MAYSLKEFFKIMESSNSCRRCNSELSWDAKLNFDGYCGDCYHELFLTETPEETPPPKKKHLDRYDLLKKRS